MIKTPWLILNFLLLSIPMFRSTIWFTSSRHQWSASSAEAESSWILRTRHVAPIKELAPAWPWTGKRTLDSVGENGRLSKNLGLGVLSPILFGEPSTFQDKLAEKLKDTVPPKNITNASFVSQRSGSESDHVVFQVPSSWWAPIMMSEPRKQLVAIFHGENPVQNGTTPCLIKRKPKCSHYFQFGKGLFIRHHVDLFDHGRASTRKRLLHGLPSGIFREHVSASNAWYNIQVGGKIPAAIDMTATIETKWY